jgi:hypothetical protein
VNGRAETRPGIEATPAQAPSRWLVVVRRDEPGLYAYLARGFEGIALVDVILDRREGEGPRVNGLAAGATGARDRRRPATARERSRWTSFGYRMVAPPPVDEALGSH